MTIVAMILQCIHKVKHISIIYIFTKKCYNKNNKYYGIFNTLHFDP